MENQKRFRIAFVTEPGKEFSSLLSHAEEIRFVCTGYEFGKDRTETIDQSLERFDPDLDCWIPVGRMLSVAETGLILGRRNPGKDIAVGVFKNGNYTWEIL